MQITKGYGCFFRGQSGQMCTWLFKVIVHILVRSRHVSRLFPPIRSVGITRSLEGLQCLQSCFFLFKTAHPHMWRGHFCRKSLVGRISVGLTCNPGRQSQRLCESTVLKAEEENKIPEWGCGESRSLHTVSQRVRQASAAPRLAFAANQSGMSPSATTVARSSAPTLPHCKHYGRD